MTAVGELALASATFEHRLHNAVALAFPDPVVAGEVFKGQGASELLRLFRLMYADHAATASLADEAEELLQLRNDVVHGHVVTSIGDDESFVEVLVNRKRRGAKRAPSAADILAAAERLDRLGGNVWWIQSTGTLSKD